MTTTHEHLVAARNLLDRGGWQQCGGGRGEGPHCVATALGEVVGSNCVSEAQHLLANHLGLPEPSRPLFAWNDAPGRTKDEVLAVLDELIAETAPLPEDLDLSELAEALA